MVAECVRLSRPMPNEAAHRNYLEGLADSNLESRLAHLRKESDSRRAVVRNHYFVGLCPQ